jgi:hypothetical protein
VYKYWRRGAALTSGVSAVDEPVQQVQDVRLGRRASLQRQFDSGKDRVLVV